MTAPFRFKGDRYKRPMAIRKRPEAPPPERWWEALLALVAMIFVLSMIFFILVILTEATTAAEKRCFTTAVGEYCRAQSQWEIQE